eukprot:SAG31_NODE_333_length_17527_cov_6.972056_8_plen_91_part_00
MWTVLLLLVLKENYGKADESPIADKSSSEDSLLYGIPIVSVIIMAYLMYEHVQFKAKEEQEMKARRARKPSKTRKRKEGTPSPSPRNRTK